jgi:hypothetical protein
MLLSIVLSFGIVGGVAADSISLFNPDPGAPVTAYSAGVTNGVTTYLLGCDAASKATGACNFTQPLTLVEGEKTFHVEITKPLTDGYTQTLTVDCPAGTTGACSVTALNTIHQITTISIPASNFSQGIVALPTAASAQALLYNGIPVPTYSASTTTSYSGNGTVTSTSYTPTATGGAIYGNSTTKGSLTKGGPSSTSSLTPPTGKSGASSQFVGAQAAVYAGLVAVVFLAW